MCGIIATVAGRGAVSGRVPPPEAPLHVSAGDDVARRTAVRTAPGYAARQSPRRTWHLRSTQGGRVARLGSVDGRRDANASGHAADVGVEHLLAARPVGNVKRRGCQGRLTSDGVESLGLAATVSAVARFSRHPPAQRAPPPNAHPDGRSAAQGPDGWRGARRRRRTRRSRPAHAIGVRARRAARPEGTRDQHPWSHLARETPEVAAYLPARRATRIDPARRAARRVPLRSRCDCPSRLPSSPAVIVSAPATGRPRAGGSGERPDRRSGSRARFPPQPPSGSGSRPGCARGRSRPPPERS